MKIKYKNYLLITLLVVMCFTCCLFFTFMCKNAEAQSSTEKNFNSEENYVCYDIIDGATTDYCYPNNEINTLAIDSKLYCNEYSSSHGSGRESGGVNILSVGCRNYMHYSFNYGSTDIAYWINMDRINAISNSSHRQKILSDIREQSVMWNQAYMYDGTGQIVNIYEVNANNSKPSSINGNKIIEVLPYDLSSDPNHSTSAGLFDPSDRTVKLNYSSNRIGYNVDTVVHEFGHVLGLNDIDAVNKVDRGTHKTLMGYSRGTTSATLSKAIKYQDVQGIAVSTGRHVCQNSHFMRYVKVGSEYRHICFYCDRIDNRTSIISGSKPIGADCGNNHDYKLMVSCGKNGWTKCTKCYKVIESNITNIVTFDKQGGQGGDNYVSVKYGEKLPIIDLPKREGYNFLGYYTSKTGGTKYYDFYDRESLSENDYYNYYAKYCDFVGDITILYAQWEMVTWEVKTVIVVGDYQRFYDEFTVTYGSSTQYKVPDVDGQSFDSWRLRGTNYDTLATGTGKTINVSYSILVSNYPSGGRIYLDLYYKESSCVVEGTLITLADGSSKAVEDLTGDEMLLVWNLETGTYDVAPILFIDSEPTGHYEVIKLSFSDGTTVDVISEHGFWDVDLNKYVYLDKYASGYIGHSFLKQGENGMAEVTLVNVDITAEVTTAYSPVTYGHLCYYVNGMLSMPGGIDGLFNIFEVDNETMMYDAEAMATDIEEYGLFTYEEFYAMYPIPERIFESFNGGYLKVAVGKGLITYEQIGKLIERYSNFF